MVDPEGDVAEPLLEEARLHVDHRDGVVLRQGRRHQMFDVDLEQMRHRAILGARDPAEGRDGRRGLGPAEHDAERERRRDGVGIWIVLHQDQHARRGIEDPADPRHARPRDGAPELGLDETLQHAAARQHHGVADVRSGLAIVTEDDDRRHGRHRTDGRQHARTAQRRHRDEHRIMAGAEGTVIHGLAGEVAGHHFATLPHDGGACGCGGDDVDRREGRRGREQSAQKVVRADEDVPHGQVRSMNLERSITRPLLP